jgi:hypothetical protein
MKKRRRLTAKQKKYFAPKKRRKGKVSTMARGRYRKAYTRARGYGRSAGGKFGGIIPPILGGVADNIIGAPMGIEGLGATAVGMFMGSPTVRDIGLYRVGGSLGGVIGGLFGKSGTSTGGGWL